MRDETGDVPGGKSCRHLAAQEYITFYCLDNIEPVKGILIRVVV